MVCQQYLRFLLQECLQMLVTEKPKFQTNVSCLQQIGHHCIQTYQAYLVTYWTAKHTRK